MNNYSIGKKFILPILGIAIVALGVAASILFW